MRNLISIDPPDAGRVIYEELDGVVIQGARVEQQRYWDMEMDTPQTIYSPDEKRFQIVVNKKLSRIRYANESEDEVTIIIEPREVPDAPTTGKLPAKASDYR